MADAKHEIITQQVHVALPGLGQLSFLGRTRA